MSESNKHNVAPNEIEIKHHLSRSGKVRVYAKVGHALVPVYETQVSRSKRYPNGGAKEIAKAARRVWRHGNRTVDIDCTDPSNPHIHTDECGFDRNASHNLGAYCCTCGWDEAEALFDKRNEIR